VNPFGLVESRNTGIIDVSAVATIHFSGYRSSLASLPRLSIYKEAANGVSVKNGVIRYIRVSGAHVTVNPPTIWQFISRSISSHSLQCQQKPCCEYYGNQPRKVWY